jgi:hypothetical protein
VALDLRSHWPQLLIAWLLLSLMALNFLHVVRPIPLGFDDTNSYLMRPRAMAALGKTICSTATFQWEYLTSIGFVLFGRDSTFGATASMMINWLAGPLAVSAILAFGSALMQPQPGGDAAEQHRSRGGSTPSRFGYGLLAACLYYAMPLVSHFSYADMKVDNAVFFMGALATLALFQYLFGRAQTTTRKAEQQSTAPVETVRSEPGVPFTTVGRQRYLLVLTGVFAGFVFAMKLTALMIGISVVAVLVLVVWLDHHRLRTVVATVAVVLSSAAVGVVPWLVHNALRYDSAMPLPVSTAPKIHEVHFDIHGLNPGAQRPSTRTLPADLAIDTSSRACQLTDRAEELDRYWGPGRGAERYGTLWWRTVMNLDVGGYYVTMFPAMLLAPLALLLPAFWSRHARWARWLGVFTGVMLLLWTFLANGVPWYGIGALLGLLLGLESLTVFPAWRPVRITMIAFVALSAGVAVSMRLSQFANERVLLDYGLGKQSAEALTEVLAPHYTSISATVLERASAMPERPFLYQVGSFIPYFLADNPQLLGIADNQLGVFNCLYQERDAALTLRRLQALGFNSILFDTRTASVERDPDGSLHQKVNAFVQFANASRTAVRTVINDSRYGVAFLLLP